MQNNQNSKNQNILNKNRLNQNDPSKKNNSLNKQQQNNLFQFEMGNELGADAEQEKTMFKDEYCKDKLISNNNQKRQNNNFNTKKNQFK